MTVLACCAWMLLGLSSTDCPGFGVSEDTLYVSSDAAVWRNALLDWSRSLKSFQGTYTVNNTYTDPLEPGTTRPEWFKVHYRRRDDAFYVSVESDIAKNEQDIYVERNNYLTYLTVNLDDPYESVYSQQTLNPGEIHAYAYPREAISVPQFLFGQDFRSYVVEESVEGFLAAGCSCMIIRDDQPVFAHFRGGRFIECQFDKGDRPVRLSFGTGCDCPADLRQFYVKEYGFDAGTIGVPWVDIFYYDYKIIGDIFFPLHITRYVYKRNQDAIIWTQQLKDRLKEIGEPPGSAEVREERCKVLAEISRLKMYEANRISDIRYIEETLSINVPLDDTCFDIALPDGTKVFDKEGRFSYQKGVTMPPLVKKLLLVGAITAATVFCLVVIGFMLYRRK
ncbi:MAG: hypothetical protein GXY07_14870 [Candidatus Hydrogenedentes bacterium]|nr:hypothetical protein [Candidatus Hydrogenedentota bacterium]